VTKGAIYGHFSSKEDLLLSAIEAAPAADFGTLNDGSRPLRERLADSGRITLEEPAPLQRMARGAVGPLPEPSVVG
jgi:AcrR family transcriptional regulator